MRSYLTQHKVKAAFGFHQVLIFAAFGSNVCASAGSVECMDVFSGDVNVVQKVFFETSECAGAFCRAVVVKFSKVEHHGILETDLTAFV